MNRFLFTALISFTLWGHSASIDESIEKGVTFLVSHQNPNGSWGAPTKTKYLNIYAPGMGAHLAFKNATSSLCLLALLRLPDKGVEVEKSILSGLAYLLKSSPKVRRANQSWIGNVWTHMYTIKALLEARGQGIGNKQDLEGEIRRQIGLLETYQYLDGGWGYYDFKSHTFKPSGSSTSFLTGSCLIVLKKAKAAGLEVSDKVVKRALDFMIRQRKPDNSFLYSNEFKFATNLHVNKKISSLARTQTSLRAIYEWTNKEEDREFIEEWTSLLIERNMWLDMARKRPVPHESWNKIAAYFYYYGMFYGAENLALCKDKKSLAQKMSLILVERQERNGSWFDFPLYNYGHFYGTAYGLMALQSSQKALAD